MYYSIKNIQRISLLWVSFHVCVTHTGEPHYSRWSLSSFIAYVIKPRCSFYSCKNYVNEGRSLGLNPLSLFTWKYLLSNRCVEMKKKCNNTIKIPKNVDKPSESGDVIVNILSTESGIGKDNKDNETENKDVPVTPSYYIDLTENNAHIYIDPFATELHNKVITDLKNHYKVWVSLAPDNRYLEDTKFNQKLMKYKIPDDMVFKYQKVKEILHKLPIKHISEDIKTSLCNAQECSNIYRSFLTDEYGAYFGWHSVAQNGKIKKLSLNEFKPEKKFPKKVQINLVDDCDSLTLKIFNQVMQELK
ncbi:MAG TPA: hypothetical protein VGW78_05810 [Candidatus Babeliales bacterium]|nr:hypothetical protein [Candidatus Babeliales bacterium]